MPTSASQHSPAPALDAQQRLIFALTLLVSVVAALLLVGLE